jgi:hypothetical protein
LQLKVPKLGLNLGFSKPKIGVSSLTLGPGLDPRAALGSQTRFWIQVLRIQRLGFEVQIQFWVRIKTMDFSISEMDLSICAPKNNHINYIIIILNCRARWVGQFWVRVKTMDFSWNGFVYLCTQK